MLKHWQRIASVVLVLAGASPVAAQEYVYFAEAPGFCSLESSSYPNQVFSIFVLSGDVNDVDGVSFRLESQRFEVEHVVSVTAPPGVSIVGGSLFEGITVSFSVRELDHDPVLNVVLTGHRPFGDVSVHDVVLSRVAGSVQVPDFYTNGWPFDCFGGTPIWHPPDTVDVIVDEDEAFSFTAVLSTSAYPPNAEVVALDPNGWVVVPFTQWILAGCGWCVWDITTVVVPVHAPPGVPNGALNPITLQMNSFGATVDEQTVVLRAVTKVSAQSSSWGAVKAKYE